MAARFRLSPEAETQIGDIVVFIATDNEKAALRVRDSLYAAFQQLADMPGMGHTRKDITDRPLKFWTVYSYLVAYDPESNPLTILAVLHGARDLGKLFSEPNGA